MTEINLEKRLREHKETVAVFVTVLFTSLALVAG